jgi:hypothetical protein
MNGSHEAPIIIPILDGQRCLGHVLERGRLAFEAFDMNDVSVGVFLSTGEAADALLITSRSRWLSDG